MIDLVEALQEDVIEKSIGFFTAIFNGEQTARPERGFQGCENEIHE